MLPQVSIFGQDSDYEFENKITKLKKEQDNQTVPALSPQTEIPNFLNIEYVYNTAIKARMIRNEYKCQVEVDLTINSNSNSNNHKKQLCMCNNLLEATSIVLGNAKLADPWSSWRAVSMSKCTKATETSLDTTTENLYTPWKYHKAVVGRAATTNSNGSAMDSREDIEMLISKDIGKTREQINAEIDQEIKLELERVDPPAPVLCDNPYTVPIRQWTSALLAKWMQRPLEEILKHPETVIPLDKITHFRRYGDGTQFEFLCGWKVAVKNLTNQTKNKGKKQQQTQQHNQQLEYKFKRTWQKWVDLIQVPQYLTKFRSLGWKMDEEKRFNWDKVEQDDDSNFGDIKEDNCYIQSEEGKRADEELRKLQSLEESAIMDEADDEDETDIEVVKSKLKLLRKKTKQLTLMEKSITNQPMNETEDKNNVEPNEPIIENIEQVESTLPVIDPNNSIELKDTDSTKSDTDDTSEDEHKQKKHLPIMQQTACEQLPPYRIYHMRPTRVSRKRN